ncbi:MAG: NAD(P)-binding protein [Deinococcales bacterium]
MDFDVITVGSGHNALIASAYLAQAGYKVGVFEKREIAGGAVSTAEIVKGYRFDYGGSAHSHSPHPDCGRTGFRALWARLYRHRSFVFCLSRWGQPFLSTGISKTIDELENNFPVRVRSYRRFIDDWQPFAGVVKELCSPSPL